MVAAGYPFLDLLWTMFVFFLIAAWLLLLFRVFSDIFRRHDISGWAKALWLFFTIAFPWLGAFVYLVSQGDSMSRRDLEREQAKRASIEAQVRAATRNGVTPAEELEQAKKLLDSGAIDYNEFEALKQRALA